MGDWSVDFQSFFRNRNLLVLRLELKSTHIMETVSKLDDNDTDILSPGNKDLPMVFRSEFHILIVA